MTTKIMIVTGEASGDLHGANLVRALQQLSQNLHVYGMGGEELRAVGAEVLFDSAKVSVVGIFEVFAHLKDILSAQRTLRRKMETDPPDLLILIDLPDFNFLLAKKAKKLAIPVYWYISPQVWAWRTGRVKTLKKYVDKIGVILPFEEEFLSQRGVQAKYVGHPLLDTVEITRNREQFCQTYNIDPDSKCVGLLPGSRKREVLSLLPVFLESAEQLSHTVSEPLVFLIPKASTISNHDLEEAGLSKYRTLLDIRVVEDDRYNMMAACDVAVAASGTVTLELAILEVPMVVTYKLATLTYHLGKLLVKLDYFSLVNLIAGYEAVPELLQDEVKPERICAELDALLTSSEKMSQMKNGLSRVKDLLGTKGASAKSAALAMQTIEEMKDG